jgi:hypothetical protein
MAMAQAQGASAYHVVDVFVALGVIDAGAAGAVQVNRVGQTILALSANPCRHEFSCAVVNVFFAFILGEYGPV